jgi:hypothetical protein
LPRVGERGQFGRHPIGGHRVLRQVVGADRQEVDVLEDPVGQQGGRGHLDHHAGGQAMGSALRGEVCGLGGGGDHGRHHPRLVTRRLRRGGDALELPREDAGVCVRDADATHAERRVGLFGVSGELERLVRSCVEGADHHLAAGERGQHLAVDGRLLVDGGFGVAVEETEFGAEQADALRGCCTGGPRRRAVLDVGKDRDPVAVGGGAWPAPLLGEVGIALGNGDCTRGRVGVGRDGDGAERAIDHDHRARGYRVKTVDGHHARNAQLPGDDRGVAGGPAERRREGDHQGCIEACGVDRREVLGAQDRRHVGHRHSGFG